jgi:hypothetical protein
MFEGASGYQCSCGGGGGGICCGFTVKLTNKTQKKIIVHLGAHAVKKKNS